MKLVIALTLIGLIGSSLAQDLKQRSSSSVARGYDDSWLTTIIVIAIPLILIPYILFLFTSIPYGGHGYGGHGGGYGWGGHGGGGHYRSADSGKSKIDDSVTKRILQSI